MSVTQSDIVFYSSQNMPQNDLSTVGGDINSGIRVVFEDISVTGLISAGSSDPSDSGNLTVTGRNSAGIILSENISLSGTTLVSGSQVFERILSCKTDYVVSGNVSVSGTELVGIIYSNESGFERVFYDASANALGGADKTLYEKVFLKNNNQSTALNNVELTEVVTGLYSIVQFGLENVKQSTETTINRTNPPTGVSVFGSGSSGLPQDGFLNPLDYQGIWLQLYLEDGASSNNSFYRLQVQGSST
ncbi:MAG: hypothetical protein ACXABD_04675 [Candidatus Thorarchaeota archaeon]|jgi:hypothetical protein